MMKVQKSSILVLVFIGLSALLSSCCDSDCFDDLQGAVEFKLFFSGTDPVKHFDPDKLELLDSIYLIKTVAGDTSTHLDTIYNFEKEYFTRTHCFLLNSDLGFDYILGNRDPAIHTVISNFVSEVSKGSGKCGCQETKKLSITTDTTDHAGVNLGPIWVYR
jgi:hypothetical protein